MKDEIRLCFGVLCMIIGMALLAGIFIDYWNGTARASLIKKQTGIEYTWREAAQIKNMYDRNNIRIVFDEDNEVSK